ncbi:ferritin-like domain-containing protein [Maricaulaceae bacterium EIL42A08]|nr:ferritin-like domain-containing protein [Maricaulaceae bacterium EIL42A08]MCP2678790.1 ferritin-like domain-containing protein [Maricaulaceae bacterium NA33B04]
MPLQSLQQAAVKVLTVAAPSAKAEAARDCAKRWRTGALASPTCGATCLAPTRPARPEAPELLPPGQVPRRRLGTVAGRIALLHAVAHIEFNAIDLAFDMVARFGGDPRISQEDRHAFVSDWVSVGEDEARHFMMIRERLQALGADYGDLPAHDGLWEAAEATSGDLAARLAVAPMVLEARGLDVTPGMIDKLKSVGDPDSAAVLNVIYTEEVAHVAAGRRWFEAVCASEGEDPTDRFHTLVRTYFKGDLKRPFNTDARDQAGMPGDWYEPLADLSA